ncbi:hypothetical protein H2200_010597 [Cladophialophora chaetospira]|uniref:FAD-binding PCMH-type domain-containing protein n=1 Tax=Cladophialophora chaetospira TaxID=386627 RepID=A0AA38X1Z4_9EURO|nr:hypothetical protein H2200_010597 [Cladophialophora chaetospira]
MSHPNAYKGPAVTAAAGENLGAALALANQHGTMVIVGSSASVGVGGFLTGGGQSLLSSQKGLAADAVLELSVVLPSGKVITANACEHPDIFWAIRGGGGSTLGVVLNFTFKAFPSEPVSSLQFVFESPTLNEDKFWQAVTFMATQFPMLANAGVTTFAGIAPGNSASPAIFSGVFQGTNQSAAQTAAVIQPLADHLNSSYGADIRSQITDVQEYASYHDWFRAQQSEAPTPLGVDLAFASRILDEKALNHPNFTALIRKAAAAGVAFNGVAGPGTHAYPSDFNVVTPAWRTGYVHASVFIIACESEGETPADGYLVVATLWPPFNATAKALAIETLTNDTSAALRELAPDTGSYLNEASAYEPNFQQAFWGSNYPRLLGIKKALDPRDVFWCQACAGSERWEEIDGVLCRV